MDESIALSNVTYDFGIGFLAGCRLIGRLQSIQKCRQFLRANATRNAFHDLKHKYRVKDYFYFVE